MNDWVKTYRSTLKWGWFTDVSTAHLWEYIRLKAYWDENYYKGELIGRGSFPTTIAGMAVETGLSQEQVRLALKKLKSTGEIDIRTTNKYSVITVIKWAEYQGDDTSDTKQTYTQECTQTTNEKQTKNTQTTRPLYQKEIKKVRNKEFIIPSIDEVREYCESRHNGIDPEAFIDFYASKNWMVGRNKMADWRAAIRNWERSRRTNVNTKQEERPTYDASNNKNVSLNEEKELMKILGKFEDKKGEE